MAAAAVLYVGDDVCHRIPVMESAGIVVLRAECSIAGVRRSLARAKLLSAVTFHNDLFPPARAVVSTAREFSRAPLILFRNPFVECDDRLFDLVLPVGSPAVWSKSLAQTLEESRRICEASRQLRQDCEAARDWSQVLREVSKRNRICPIDEDTIFRPDEGNDS